MEISFDSFINRLQKTYIPKLDDPTQIAKGEDGSYGKIDTHGDMLFEGRYGNSLRIGNRFVNPHIFISNARGDTNKVESLNITSKMVDHGSQKIYMPHLILLLKKQKRK